GFLVSSIASIIPVEYGSSNSRQTILSLSTRTHQGWCCRAPPSDSHLTRARAVPLESSVTHCSGCPIQSEVRTPHARLCTRTILRAERINCLSIQFGSHPDLTLS